jgi:hypothetical protein
MYLCGFCLIFINIPPMNTGDSRKLNLYIIRSNVGDTGEI